MMLQLDPRHEFVWRSPSSLQLGIDRPVVVLDEVTEAQERMLAALVVGVTVPGFDLVARAADADERTARALLRAVRPALRTDGAPSGDDADSRGVGEAPHPRPLRSGVVIAGYGPTADAVASLLRGAGIGVRPHDEQDEPGSADVAVIVDHFVVDPSVRGFWLRRDIAHLPVVIGDSAVRVGPFIEPGTGPCLWCLDRIRSDADPAWPAIASQLLGRRSSADRGLIAVEAAALATRLVISRLARPPASEAPRRSTAARSTSTTLQIGTGARSTEQWSRHPECGCSTLLETENLGASPSDSPRLRPTTVLGTV